MSDPDPFERLHRRLKAFTGGDPGAVLDPLALVEVDALWRATAVEGGYPLSTVLTVGAIYWCRYIAQPVGPDQAELDAALHVVGSIVDIRGDAVPVTLKELLRDGRPERHGHWLAAQARALLKGGFDRTDPDALRKTTGLLEAALAALPEDDAERLGDAELLGEVLLEQYRISGRLADVDEAIRFERRFALEYSSAPDRRRFNLSRLSGALHMRYAIAGAIADLDAAIAVDRSLLDEIGRDRAARALVLSNLGRSLCQRFLSTGDRAALDEAEAAGREAVELAAATATDRVAPLTNLGATLLRRFEAAGARHDLDESIALGRKAAALAEADSDGAAVSLTNLAVALIRRFEHFGSGEDVDAAIDYGRRAVAASRMSDPARATRMANLESALLARFIAQAEHADLDEAIAVGRDLLHSLPPERAVLLPSIINHTVALRARHRREGNSTDLDEAVRIGRDLVRAAGRSNHDRLGLLVNLAGALLDRSELPGCESDLDEAVAAAYEAVETEGSDGRRFGAHQVLAKALDARYKRTGDRADLDESIRCFREVSQAETAPAADRINAAQAAASRLVLLGQRMYARSEQDLQARTHYLARLGAGLAEYQTAVDLLPLLVWTGAPRRDRWSGLDQTARTLGREAAACALAMGEAKLAVRILEQSRGLLWAQLLDLRDDLSALTVAHPEIAADIEECRRILDAPDAAVSFQSDLRIGAAQRFLELKSRVRSLPPSRALPRPQEFLLPPRFEDLLPPSGSGPVVVVNTSSWRCDAIILWSDEVTVVELDFTGGDAADHADRYMKALRRYSGAEQTVQLEMATRPVLEWMWKAIAEPVLAELDRRPAAGGLHRVWWCPTGVLTLLPIHAAGYHYRDDGTTVLDRAVSSYTPTLRTLAHARSRVPAGDGADALVVTAAAPGAFPDLPGADRERRMLLELLGEEAVLVLHDEQATREAVLAELAGRRFVHIACHGVQDLDRPAEGGLVPFDWRSSGFINVNDLAALPSNAGQMAFLSACRTASGGAVNLEESVSLTAAMQHLGWRHVIGTLWTVGDDDASTVAESFYRRIARGGRLVPEDSAQSLHEAVRALRDQDPRRSARWARFVHYGP